MVSLSYDEGDTTSQTFNNSSIRMDNFIKKKKPYKSGAGPHSAVWQSGSSTLKSGKSHHIYHRINHVFLFYKMSLNMHISITKK